MAKMSNFQAENVVHENRILPFAMLRSGVLSLFKIVPGGAEL
jgi:hypothetical protein